MKKAALICMLTAIAFSSKAQTIEEAKRYTLNEQYEEASSIFRQLVAKFPLKGDYWFYFGENLLQAENTDSAKTLYTLGVQNELINPLNFIGLAKIAKIEGNKELADQQFAKALQMGAGKNAEVFIRVAEAYITINPNDIPKAFTLLKDAEKLQLRNPEIQILNGDAYMVYNDGSSAIKYYEKAQELNPSSPIAMQRLGKLWVNARNLVGKDGAKGALDYYNEAIKTDSSYAPAYLELGELYSLVQRYEDAKKNYEKYLELSKGTINSRVLYASTLYKTKDYSGALKEINSIWQTDTSRTVLYRLAAYSAYETKDFPNGISYINKFFGRHPVGKLIPKDYAYLGKLLSATGQDSIALEKLNFAFSQDTLAFDLLSDIASVYTKMKKYKEASEAYEKKIKLTKASSRDYHLLGISYYKMNEFGKADSAFSRVTELAPKFVQGFDWKARAQSMLDPDSKAGLAKVAFEQVVVLAESDSAKYSKELMSAYKYLGSYYFIITKDFVNAKIWWEKVKAMDPNDKQAIDALGSKEMK
jgi:tetratricopeptide (TPR) repeat protein